MADNLLKNPIQTHYLKIVNEAKIKDEFLLLREKINQAINDDGFNEENGTENLDDSKIALQNNPEV